MTQRSIPLPDAGFSIVEAIVTIGILVVMIFAVSVFQRDIYLFNNFLSNSLESQDELRRAFKTMTAEMRSMVPSSIGTYPLLQTATSSIIFYSNVDGDVLKERVRYFLDNGVLKRGIVKPTGNPLVYNLASETVVELAHSVVNATSTALFSYYDDTYDGTTAPLVQPVNASQVRLLRIDVLLDQDPLRPPGPLVFTTQVSPRNLKDNL